MSKILFVGTSEFAVPALRALRAAKKEVAAVVTQPDRSQGRGLNLEPSPVKRCALEAGLPVLQPEDVNAAESVEAVLATGARLAVVAAYGQKLSKRLLSLLPGGWYNLHASLLPRHRGASPVVRALLDGDEWTGVTIFRIVPKMDAGPVVAIARHRIAYPVTGGALTATLSDLSAALLLDVLPALEEGRALELPQDETQATSAGKLSKEAGRIDWREPAAAIARKIYAFQPWPGAFTALKRKDGAPVRVMLIEAAVENGETEKRGDRETGRIVAVGKNGIDVLTGEGTVRIAKLKPDGKREMTAGEFANGCRLAPGDAFGNVE